jgi:hypothetical protein
MRLFFEFEQDVIPWASTMHVGYLEKQDPFVFFYGDPLEILAFGRDLFQQSEYSRIRTAVILSIIDLGSGAIKSIAGTVRDQRASVNNPVRGTRKP